MILTKILPICWEETTVVFKTALATRPPIHRPVGRWAEQVNFGRGYFVLVLLSGRTSFCLRLLVVVVVNCWYPDFYFYILVVEFLYCFCVDESGISTYEMDDTNNDDEFDFNDDF